MVISSEVKVSIMCVEVYAVREPNYSVLQLKLVRPIYNNKILLLKYNLIS